MSKKLAALVLPLALLASAPACGPQHPQPNVASSAGDQSYAARYPDLLQASQKRLEERQREARTHMQAMEKFPGELKGVESELARSIVRRADEAGRSRSYAEGSAENATIEAFFEEDRDAVGRSVAGAAQYQAKQKGCDVDVGSAAAHELKRSVDKQLEKRLRGRNDGQLLVDKHRVQLGKENVAALEKQVDEISRASFLVNVGLPEERARLGQLLGEASGVKRSLETTIAEEQNLQKESARSDAEKKASVERVSAAQKALASLDPTLERARALELNIDRDIKASREEYSLALATLLDRLAAKK